VRGRGSSSSGGVFISYRRGESAYPVAWLYRNLVRRLGADAVFKDVDSIQPGDEFATTLDRALSRCRVLLAIIGPDWLDACDARGRRRLDDPQDFVRLEIESGLARGIRVVPVLVAGAAMPRQESLAEGLADLSSRQAAELTPGHFEDDAQRLIDVVVRTLREGQRASWAQPIAKIRGAGPRSLIVGAAVLAVAVITTLAWWAAGFGRDDTSPSYDLAVTTAGAVATDTFEAAAGERISAEITGNTVPDGYLTILAPGSGATLGEAVLSGASAFINTVTIASTGTYTLQLNPSGAHTGRTTVVLHRVPADTGRIAFDVPLTLVSSVPGQNPERTFEAVEGQRISVEITGNSVDEGYLNLLEPRTRDRVTDTPLPEASGFLDTVTIASTGTYTLQLNPSGAHTGRTTIVLRRPDT
jgi:hypothetical protein